MHDAWTGLLTMLAGVGLGALFFGGLWWTLRRGMASDRPVLWFVGSFVIRSGITVLGFYVVSDGHWQRLLLCTFGFGAARMVATRVSRQWELRHAAMVREIPRAS